jgi:hypothetical protein
MKVDIVELHPDNSSDFAVLSFKDPTRDNSYNVKSIVGLDADNIVPKHYGAAFFNMALQSREIVMKIGLNPNFSAGESFASLRDRLYKMIASSRTGLVDIWFRYTYSNDAFTTIIANRARISGFITKFEAAQFERTQEVQITISAIEPFLKSFSEIPVDVSGPLFTPMPIITNIMDTESTAPHGFDFDITFLGFVATFSMSNPFDASWSFDVSPVGGFGDGDVLHFSSEPKDKKLYIQRGATQVPLGDVIAPGSIWPIIFPGDNYFTFDNYALMEWTNLSYYNAYWGV